MLTSITKQALHLRSRSSRFVGTTRTIRPQNRGTSRKLHVAIVGSGPAGFFATEELFKSTLKDVKVDMYERLPTPYGLVRYGVAPDHPEVKVVDAIFHNLAQSPKFNFVGNVNVGTDISIQELKEHYEVVILAYGAEDDRKLGIPGEHLKGIHSARSFVEWYNGYPLLDSAKKDFDLSNTDAVIIGNGNVAIDVARILVRDLSELAPTDITEEALNALRASNVRKISLVGRRGPVQAAFTTGELRELVNLKNVDKWIPDRLLLTNEADDEELKIRQARRKFELLQKILSYNEPRSLKQPHVTASDAALSQPVPRLLQFYFLRSPVEFIEDPHKPGHVGSVKFEHNILHGAAGAQKARGINFFSEIPAQLVFTSIGYSAKPMPGVPFDEAHGYIPNDNGRVEKGRLYVSGWIKRGPTGVIATNKIDAEQVVATIVNDLENADSTISMTTSPHAASIPLDKIRSILQSRNVRPVSFDDWLKMNRVELEEGTKLSKSRKKIESIQDMLKIADGPL